MCRRLMFAVLVLALCLISTVRAEDVVWDFENGNDHGFTLWSVVPAVPAPDDPDVAGDETLTGGWEPGNPNNLPEAGVAWTVGPPTMFDGLLPGADPAHARVDANGLLNYSLGTSRMTSDHGFLSTYNLNLHGDFVHTLGNDQIATSPIVQLYAGAILTATVAGSGADHEPILDPDPALGYADGSGGIAVLSAEDGTLLASMETEGRGGEDPFVLDLSAFAGQKVVIEAVDAHEGGWGWMAVDKIVIANAAVLEVVWDFENGNDHGFTLWSVVPAVPAPDDPNTAGDEALTGGWEEGNPNNLPEAGVTWTIGPPTMMDGLLPGADPAHARVDANGLLNYSLGTSRMTPDHGFLSTYNLNLHGDFVHTQGNDQIASSPIVELYAGALLTATVAGSGADHEPVLDPDPALGYADGSGGIAVLSADDGTLLASMETEGRGGEDPFVLDLSAFAGQKVLIEAVDAHEGGWGWMAVDEIRVTNARVLRTAAMIVSDAELSTGFDQAQHDHLIAMGYEVTVVPSADVGSTFTILDADTCDLLLISESISSSGADPLIGTKTPVMHNEAYGWDNWLVTSGTNITWVSVADVNIVNDAHPIPVDAGISAGLLPFFSPGTGATADFVSSLAPGAELIAQTTVDGNDFALIFTVERDGELADGSAAPARFAGFSVPANQVFDADRMTDEAWALWRATINWLISEK